MRPRESRDPDHLDDIKESCSLIIARTKNIRLPDFVANLSLQDGILMRLIIIGEASKNLSDAARKRYPDASWKEIVRLRDLTVHHYRDIDALKIWKIIREDVPRLLEILS